MKRGSLLLFIIFCCCADVTGQKIIQSKEFAIRNDKFYDFFTMENGRHLLFRDKGEVEILEVLNEKLESLNTIEINIDARRKSIDAIVPYKDKLNIYYSHREGRKGVLSVMSIDANTLVQDTSRTILVGNEVFIKGNLKMVLSEDKKTVLFFEKTVDGINIMVVDNESKELLYSNIFKSELLDLYSDFKKIIITNDKEVYLVFEKDNERYSMGKHRLYVAKSMGRDFIMKEYDLSNTLNTGIKAKYNEINKSLSIAGLYSKETEEDIIGYFIYDEKNRSPNNEIVFTPFKEQMFADLYGKNTKRDHTLQDFYITDIINRQDGGVLLIFESYREFVRRSAYSTMTRYESDNLLRGFVDYYNEDLIVVSVDNQGTEDWYRVFYKKQFSQDDGAVFSSYTTLHTPRRVHIIYNDEIKKSSTVSEYVFSPSGKNERNTILNTEYKDLQIRLGSAKQIGPNVLLAPSEVNYKLSLVQINI